MMDYGYLGHGSTFGIAAIIFRGFFSLAILVGLVLLVIWLVRPRLRQQARHCSQ